MGIFFKIPAPVEITELPEMFEGKDGTPFLHRGFRYENGILTLLKNDNIFYSAPVSSYQLLCITNNSILLCADGLPKSLEFTTPPQYVKEFHMLKFLLQRDAKNLNLSYAKACRYINSNYAQTTPTNSSSITPTTPVNTAPMANTSGTPPTANAVPDNFVGYTSNKIQFTVSGDRLRLEKKAKYTPTRR